MPVRVCVSNRLYQNVGLDSRHSSAGCASSEAAEVAVPQCPLALFLFKVQQMKLHTFLDYRK